MQVAILAMVALSAIGAEKIAVLQVSVDGGADPVIGTQMTGRIAEIIGTRPDVEVIAPDDIRALLEKETEKQLLGCDDDSCLAEIGGMLGADVLVKGRVSKIEAGYAVTLNAVDARRATPLAHVSDTWGGTSIGLLDLMEPLVDRLLAKDKSPVYGSIEVLGAEDGSRVFVDDEVRGTAPAGTMGKVPIGARRIRVQSDDHVPFERWVVVKANKTTAVPVVQAERSSDPFYTTWWFWTVAAVGVAGATVATVALTSGGTPAAGATGVNVAVDADAAFTGGR